MPSPSGYAAFFHRAQVKTAEGEVLDCGVVTKHGHRPAYESDPADAIAVVRAGDDEHGGWIAGSLVAEATVNDAAKLRRSGLSGEWDELESGFELRSLRLVNEAAAVLGRSYRGFPAPYDRLDVDVLREREHQLLGHVREILDEHGPEMLRRVLDEWEAKRIAERVASLPASRPLPPRVP